MTRNVDRWVLVYSLRVMSYSLDLCDVCLSIWTLVSIHKKHKVKMRVISF